MQTEVTIPDIHRFDQIFVRAKEKAGREKIRAALVTPTEPDMLRAVAKMAQEGMLEPILIGAQDQFEAACGEHAIEFPPGEFVEIADTSEAVAKTCDMIQAGKINLIVKGRIMTGDLLKMLFLPDSGFASKDKIVSHVAVMKPEKYSKLLMVTDGAVNILPDLKTKLALIDNLVRVGSSIGLANPRIALLAAVEVIYPQMPVTMEAAIIAKMWERGQIKGAIVDGPLSFDCAVDMVAAHSKGIKNSQVAGQADALVAPNLETANGIYKGMALYGKCQMGGIIVGGKLPIALGSRSDSWEGKFNSLLLGILNAPNLS
ncbi:MAG: phosphate acyltransferase [candidate division Zixibacteria bacterium]|nr:phosphate acyltransferase [candidate division Zixibacteria bacterium]